MTTEPRDWGGYGAILIEGQAMAVEDAKRPVIDCPRCGMVLVVNSRGLGSCPMGHFRTWDTANGGT